MFKKIIPVVILIIVVSLFLTNTVLAGPITEGVTNFGSNIFGKQPKSPLEIAALIIRVILTFLGIIFLCLTLYGGFLYMTSQGKEDQIKKAKDTIIAAIIGLVIVLSSYAITTFVVSVVVNATNAPGGSGSTPNGGSTPIIGS